MSNSSETHQELDVRTLVPIERHKLLTRLFKELPVGHSFTFTNDHDPKPLYYEFCSIYGDVVGWEYIQSGGDEWTVKVTRTGESEGRKFTGASTLMDLRKTKEQDSLHAVFHRYGMMEEGDTMELLAAEIPSHIESIFKTRFANKCTWEVKEKTDDEVTIHITKLKPDAGGDEKITVVRNFDIRPYPPAQRHEMFYEAFEQIAPGEAFEFVNDHDPKPLYYQMEAEQKVPFKWEYLESGPEDWRVRVSKLHA